MVVKTFRGVLADEGQDRIRLSTIKGKVGYRLISLKTIPILPGTAQVESIIKIYKTYQSTVDASVDFTDSDLMAVNYTTMLDSPNTQGNTIIIVDTEVVNQDIYVTAFDADGTFSMSYVIELEVVPLDDAVAEYTTLKDMRQS